MLARGEILAESSAVGVEVQEVESAIEGEV